MKFPGTCGNRVFVDHRELDFISLHPFHYCYTVYIPRQKQALFTLYYRFVWYVVYVSTFKHTSFSVHLSQTGQGVQLHVLVSGWSTRRQRFLHNRFTILQSTHSAERIFWHLAALPKNSATQYVYDSVAGNRFKVIKEMVAAVIWGFISFLLWGMAGSRSRFAKLFFCAVLTSLSIWSTPSLHYERWSEEGLARGAWKEMRALEEERIKERQHTQQKKHERIGKVVLQSLSHSADIEESRKAQCPCVCVCGHTQFCPNKAQINADFLIASTLVIIESFSHLLKSARITVINLLNVLICCL